MSKAFQLQIPKPCHENWDQMTQADKGKFCASCQKQVIDFTSMSDRELAAFFKKPSTGSVCGRFNDDQLNKELEIPRKRIPWLKYFFTIAIPAFFASSKAVAQGEVTKKISRTDTTTKVNKTQFTVGKTLLPNPKFIKPRPIKHVEIIKSPSECKLMGDISVIIPDTLIKVVEQVVPNVDPEKTIAGKIIDENGDPVPYSTIKVKGTYVTTAADSAGNFTLKNEIPIPTLEVSAVGFESKEQIIFPNRPTNITLIEMVQLKTALTGAVVVTRSRCYKPTNPLPLITRIFKDTSFKNFKFYPNPATPGSNITIEWEKREAGNFEIQLLNQDGQFINRKTEIFVEKINSVQYSLPNVAAGNYFLVMINRKTGKRITEKIIVQ